MDGISEVIRAPLLKNWEHIDEGWMMGGVVVHEERWKQTFMKQYHHLHDEEAGIGQFQ